MRKLLIIPIILLSQFALGQTTYYVSETGTGDTLTSLSEVQSLSLVSGDTILFKRGDEFYGSLSISSVNNLTISAYGTGANPIIHGWETLSSWTDEGGGIYSVTTSVDGDNTLLYFDGVNSARGRTEAARTYTINDSVLVDIDYTWDTDLIGSDVVITDSDFSLERIKIQNINGSTIYLERASNTTYAYYYFIQNDTSLCDTLGEWAYDEGSGKIFVYFGAENPATHTVKIASLQYLISMTGVTNSTFKNVDFQGAYNTAINGTFFGGEIDSCNISFCYDGINFGHTETVSVTNSSFYDISNLGIYGTGTNYDISYNNFVRIGHIPGSIPYYGESASISAISVLLYSNYNIISYNNISYTGYSGLSINGHHSTIEYNFIYTTMEHLRDGAGIYMAGSWVDNAIIRYNIVDNSNMGIYMDSRAHDANIYGNSVFNCSEYNLFLHMGSNDTIYNNTFYNGNNAGVEAVSYLDTDSQVDSILFKDNIVVSYNDNINGDYFWHVTSFLNEAEDDMGTIDSNIYVDHSVSTFQFVFHGAKNLGEWQNAGYDSNSIYKITTTEYYYNPTLNDSTITFIGETRTDVYDSVFTDSVVMQPFSSKVLINCEGNNITIDAVQSDYVEDIGWMIDITPSGSTPPYTYLWSNYETTQDVHGLTGESYSVTVVDAYGCPTASDIYTVTYSNSDSLKGYYKFNQDLADSSGYGFNGSGTVTYSGGVSDSSVFLNGTTINIGSNPEIQKLGTDNFTISYWLNNTSASGTIISNFSFNNYGYRIYVSGADQQSMFVAASGYTNSLPITTFNFNNDWKYTTFTRSNDTIRVYRNGVLANTKTITDCDSSIVPTVLGQAGTFIGYLDELKFYNRTMSQNEIERSYYSDIAVWKNKQINLPVIANTQEPVQINSSFDYAYDSVVWSSDVGTFDTATIFTPVYTPLQTGYATATVYLNNQTITDSLLISIDAIVDTTFNVTTPNYFDFTDIDLDEVDSDSLKVQFFNNSTDTIYISKTLFYLE